MSPPPITNVWLLVLSQQNFKAVLAQRSQDPYLAGLLAKGTLLNNYKPSLPSELASPATAATFTESLTNGGLSWRAYLEEPSSAGAPNNVALTQLGADLLSPSGPPSLSWIVPSACHNGAPTPCAAGAPAGLAGADAFLHQILPPLLTSSAYRAHGLIVITFDPGSPAGATTPAPANSKRPASTSAPVGALLLSPFVRRDARVSGAYDELSLLKSLARIFGVPPLGHAADANVKQFGGDVYRATKKAA